MHCSSLILLWVNSFYGWRALPSNWSPRHAALAYGLTQHRLSPPARWRIAHHSAVENFFRYTLARTPNWQYTHEPTLHRQCLAHRADPTKTSGGSRRSHQGLRATRRGKMEAQSCALLAQRRKTRRGKNNSMSLAALHMRIHPESGMSNP